MEEADGAIAAAIEVAREMKTVTQKKKKKKKSKKELIFKKKRARQRCLVKLLSKNWKVINLFIFAQFMLLLKDYPTKSHHQLPFVFLAFSFHNSSWLATQINKHFRCCINVCCFKHIFTFDKFLR